MSFLYNNIYLLYNKMSNTADITRIVVGGIVGIAVVGIALSFSFGGSNNNSVNMNDMYTNVSSFSSTGGPINNILGDSSISDITSGDSESRVSDVTPNYSDYYRSSISSDDDLDMMMDESNESNEVISTGGSRKRKKSKSKKSKKSKKRKHRKKSHKKRSKS